MLRFLLTGILFITAADCADSGYVGSKVCFGCHQDIYRSYLKTDMGRSMRSAGELSAGQLPPEAALPVAGTNRSLKVFRRDNAWFQSESEPGLFEDEHRLDYVVGSGANGVSFLTRRGDFLFQTPLSYYSKPAKWDFSPGYQSADIGFSRPITQECVLCHSGRPQASSEIKGRYLDPPFAELAIGCEKCHGPGAVHVQKPSVSGSIVNPAKLPARTAEDICENCHQGGDARVLEAGKNPEDFRPGQQLVETVAIFEIPQKLREAKTGDLLQHHQAMKASRCFRESGGKLSCLTCHDPHTQPRAEQAAQFFRAKCLTCHNDQNCTRPAAQRADENCIGCHMPKRSVAVISHSALTNHRIPRRPDQQLPSEEPTDGSDLTLINAPTDRKMKLSDSMLLQAYSQVAGQNAIYQQHYVTLLNGLAGKGTKDPYVQAALGRRALTEGKNEEAVERLASLMPAADSTSYLDLSAALTHLGRVAEAVRILEQGLARDPYNAVLRKTLTLAYIRQQNYAEARKQMQSYVAMFPGDAFMRQLLAKVSH